jgi:hypothetical protein
MTDPFRLLALHHSYRCDLIIDTYAAKARSYTYLLVSQWSDGGVPDKFME